MRRLSALLFLLALTTAPLAAGAEETPIRTFSILNTEALGRELYVRDQMVAVGSDALFAAFPKAGEEHLRGWISELSKNIRRVNFIQERDGHFVLAYTATFEKTGPPKIEDQKGIPLSAPIAKRYAARVNAIKAIPKLFTDTYNFEVLDDPEGPGFLVYALAATKDPKEVVVGGHYRISVSADGTKVKQVDALSRSFLVIRNDPPKIPQTTQLAGIMVSHVVSSTPVETHVYLSLLHHQPIFVTVIADRSMWSVEDGKISKEKQPVKQLMPKR